MRAPDNDDELISPSNSTAFGLSSAVCTNDFRRMQTCIADLQVGTVNI
jgi:acyl-CoA reductase-like NAD-dependent aldehyde dehydrogenase